jgi:hypothetical protein
LQRCPKAALPAVNQISVVVRGKPQVANSIPKREQAFARGTKL